jgi:hypothetical protein
MLSSYARVPAGLLLGLLGLGLAGCGDDPPTGSLGQLSTLRFEFASVDCGARCAIDREILVGSVVGVDVYNLHRKVAYQVRSSAPNVATFDNTPRCRSLATDDCHEQIRAVTHGPGDADLEVFDEWTGTVLDRVTIHVRQATTLETTVRTIRGGTTLDLTPNQGVFELKVASDLELVSTARSASGDELLATASAIRGTYADARILGPCQAEGCGDSPVDGVETGARQQARANAAGVTVVSLVSGATHHDVPFRVVD